jgi:uncharacterized tellurite resistance protein B-like protein
MKLPPPTETSVIKSDGAQHELEKSVIQRLRELMGTGW